MRHEDPQHGNRPPWHQINIEFDSRDVAERHAIAYLGPALMAAESTGLLTSWFFTRKQWWRFRYLPTSSRAAGEAKRLLEDAARSMQGSGYASRWVENTYEPETHAFGGEEGMAAAHNLFHQDSRYIFEYLRPLGGGTLNSASNHRSKRRELSVLLCTALMRAAGQDWHEQGDIWTRVADHRPTKTSAQPEQRRTLKAAIKRLIAVDTGPETALRTGGTLEFATDWLTIFEQSRETLKILSGEGLLTRGIRSVTAHHVIFHWNRLGLPYQTQANVALAAKETIFENRRVCRRMKTTYRLSLPQGGQSVIPHHE
ncbi:MAG: thiopeptide-type bacteriocin biosynthesis protein [Pseudonocardiales bacterium]|nr:thiopeptide-type bacteriocin biosynthesis protein [Pseudonocardiales bacterium]